LVYLASDPGSLCEPLTGRRWDPDEVRRRFEARVLHFERAGLQPSDRAFIHYGNNLEFFVDLLAIWWLGAVAIPIDTRLTVFEVQALARAARPRFSLWLDAPDPEFAEPLRELDVQSLGASDRLPATLAAVPGPRLRLDDHALILFTSGTTGDPKGVVHTHRSLLARWSALREHLGTTSFRRSLCLLPTHFGHGLICNSLYPWLSGGDLFILPSFRPEVIVQLGSLLDEEEITFMSSVPPVWRLALRTTGGPSNRTLERVFCGSAPLSRDLWLQVRDWTGTQDVFNAYGITETGSWVAGTTVPDFEPGDGLVGEPWGAAVKIVRHAAALPTLSSRADECEPGEPGHIWLKTPALMQGYLDREDLTAEAVVAGWFRTGDIGAVDEQGWLWLRGRERDEVNKGGMKIYPSDVEAVAESVPGVVDVCVFAVDDPLYEQDVGIALVVEGEPDRTLAEVHGVMSTRLAKHQLPVRWYVVDEIPRTSRGKVNRTVVADACSKLPPMQPPRVTSEREPPGPT
jgi:acyl-CoA synthetase (AMP-forming)/AMP-acid ligase II